MRRFVDELPLLGPPEAASLSRRRRDALIEDLRCIADEQRQAGTTTEEALTIASLEIDARGLAARDQAFLSRNLEYEVEGWERDDQALYDLLLLGGDSFDVSLEVIAGWTDQQCQQVEDWAVTEYLIASDHDDLERLPVPAHLAAYAKGVSP